MNWKLSVLVCAVGGSVGLIGGRVLLERRRAKHRRRALARERIVQPIAPHEVVDVLFPLDVPAGRVFIDGVEVKVRQPTGRSMLRSAWTPYNRNIL